MSLTISTKNRRPCPCTTHQPKRVVITGGPGAGKTAILEIARLQFCQHVMVLPEAAGIIFSGGFVRHSTVAGKKAAQRAIYYVQRESERLSIEEGQAAIILCDRGTLDGMAYWPDTPESYFKDLQTTFEQEYSKYERVIHLETPGKDQGYNHSNPMRIESADDAIQIDQKIGKVWSGHPNRTLIRSTDEFSDKVRVALEVIGSAIPTCCRQTLVQ